MSIILTLNDAYHKEIFRMGFKPLTFEWHIYLCSKLYYKSETSYHRLLETYLLNFQVLCNNIQTRKWVNINNNINYKSSIYHACTHTWFIRLMHTFSHCKKRIIRNCLGAWDKKWFHRSNADIHTLRTLPFWIGNTNSISFHVLTRFRSGTYSLQF